MASLYGMALAFGLAVNAGPRSMGSMPRSFEAGVHAHSRLEGWHIVGVVAGNLNHDDICSNRPNRLIYANSLGGPQLPADTLPT